MAWRWGVHIRVVTGVSFRCVPRVIGADVQDGDCTGSGISVNLFTGGWCLGAHGWLVGCAFLWMLMLVECRQAGEHMGSPLRQTGGWFRC